MHSTRQRDQLDSSSKAAPGESLSARRTTAQSTQTAKARPKQSARHGGQNAKSQELQQLLETSAEQFRSLIETAAAPILLLSPELQILEVNPDAERIYCRRRGELIGKDFLTALSVGNRGGLTRANCKEALAGHPVRSIEQRVTQPDGGERVLLWNASRLADSAGRALGVIAMAQDITERQRAEEALREREARLSSVIATAPDAIITIDEHGMVQSFSKAAEEQFGYSAGEVIGRNVNMLMPSPHRENHDGYLGRYRRTGEKRIIGIGRQVEAKRKDGTIFPMELAVGEVIHGGTRIYTGFIRDITARAKMEQELRQAQKMEAIGQLTGGLAHDFNNLLTVITGNLEMLEDRLADKDDLALLGDAHEAADLGAKLASRLLAFGRRQTLNPKPIELGKLVAGMVELLSRSLGQMVQLETRLASKLRTTVADPGQVENALLNLAINARDAMPQGGRLIIETREAEIDEDATIIHADLTPGRFAVLSVTDTGVGMTPEVRQRAFEPFFTTKALGRGSGLGLSMVYGFVKQSGGHVQVDSELGQGTTVRIYLPISDQPERPEHSRREQSKRAAAGETILVVEDDPRVRRVSIRRLRELGYAVLEADSGAAALHLLRQGTPIDLVFTDIVMPGGMTGLDLAQEARHDQPELRILLTSGYADPVMFDANMLMAHTGWLSKPYNREDLASKLRELLDP